MTPKTKFPVTCHTDHVGQGSVFVAIKGQSSDGALYILDALKKGATTIVIQDDTNLAPEIIEAINDNNATLEMVSDARKALAQLSAQAAGNPARSLKIIGITGTKGKTTTSYLMFHMLKAMGIRAALISTVNNYIHDEIYPPSLTTPQADYLQQFLKKCVDQQIAWVVMEVAAHAVTLDRIYGISFDAVMITNIAQEHLEFYPSMDAYAAAKIALLSYRKPGAPAWLNGDDERLVKISAPDSYFYSLEHDASVHGDYAPQDPLTVAISLADGSSEQLVCPALIGRYNGYNLVAAVACLTSLGFDLLALKKAAYSFTGVPGRLEQYKLSNGAIAIIDYAHNPLSYQALLSTLREKTAQLIVVFGAGGERDANRRPIMGGIVARYADIIVITTDNPRSEDPRQIVADIMAGIPDEARDKIVIELDREKAIKLAFSKSMAGAFITMLGKGPDEYQQIGKIKHPFSERAIVKGL